VNVHFSDWSSAATITQDVFTWGKCSTFATGAVMLQLQKQFSLRGKCLLCHWSSDATVTKAIFT
jgi:hypothetical protein